MTADEQAIQAVLQEFEAAWNRHDGKAIAGLFAEDAAFIQIFGGQLDGRAAIEGSHKAILETIYKDSHANFQVRSIRFLHPDIAILFTRAQVRFKENNQDREIETRPTLILTKDDGKWQVVFLQNTRISEMPNAAQAAARLAR